jgi:hypothetical protein
MLKFLFVALLCLAVPLFARFDSYTHYKSQTYLNGTNFQSTSIKLQVFSKDRVFMGLVGTGPFDPLEIYLKGTYNYSLAYVIRQYGYSDPTTASFLLLGTHPETIAVILYSDG